MAKCDEGYLCCVCGNDVANITESDLYLRFVIGMIDPELLHVTPERHIRCNPLLAQFIVADDFEAVAVEDEFSKSLLDRDFVHQKEGLVTRGWQRLQQIRSLGEISMLEYPLPEVVEQMKNKASQN